ncbi:alpha/beta hydrolase [Erythrobacter sp. F6033]|uniref:alpha/beta fold hydrolase n=1 Tax=Erythrobacter sp. F6033 TaxID=2926401 RepID=UPI001FF27065|nr:alpha/beta hydrolase [Erythrobacter sp. F6033]MCK0128134.1 alpha/beta hydrolase [Erythrobacter sp. F6033]
MDTRDWRNKARYFDYQGHQIAYWVGENTNARPLLLVHGFPTCAWDWVPVWETLGAQHHLIACDMLGFGLSDKPRSGYSIHLQTDIQTALLNHLGIGEFDALVHDYGVSVGQELLARQQENSAAAGLGKMVFLNGGIFPDQHRARPIQKLGVSPFGFLLGLLFSRKGFGKSFSEVFGPETQPSEAELDAFWEFISHKDGNRITHKLLHYIADRVTHKTRWEAALVAAEDKVGLINGALDPVSGKHAYDRWRATVPNARHHLIETVGHYPQVEAPREVAAKALEWLSD